MRIRHKIRVIAYKRGGDKVALFLRLSMYRSQQDFSLGIVLPDDCYDKISCRVCNHPHAEFFNGIIADGASALDDVIQHYGVNVGRMPTSGEVRELFNAKFNGIERTDRLPKSLPFLIDEFCTEEGHKRSWTIPTHQKFKSLLGNITAFRQHTQINDITEQWMDDFVRWYIRKGYTNPTIAKKMGFLRWFLRWCENRGYYKGNAHKTFGVKLKGQNFEQKTIIYLERNELARLENYDFSKTPYLDKARDLFVFSCYSGLRYSDIANLTKEQVTDSQICVVTRKTDDRLYIDLNTHTRRILSKYNNLKGHNALPVISNQRANDYIKEACRIAGIDATTKLVTYKGANKIEVTKPKYECISFHAGRRTFITMALLLEIPIPVIMQWSGHKDVKMLKPYMAIVDELRKREMDKFNDL